MPRSKPRPSQQARPVENVPVSWLLKAIGAVFLAAAACIYATLCLLYHYGQWQIVLHPVRAASQPAPSANLIRFAPNDAGQPQLTGKSLAAPANGRYSGFTVLFLAGGDGSVSDANPILTELQDLGLNVFAFDYRGYGFSANLHPSQLRMTDDAEAAWSYLISTRKVSPSTVIPYGTGVGASLAAALAAAHPEIKALILDSPHVDLLELARRDSPSIVPVRLLFHERFSLREPLSRLQTPKLLLVDVHTPTPEAYVSAADPKLTVFLPSRSGHLFDQAITRFLDEYLNPMPPVTSMAPSVTNQP